MTQVSYGIQHPQDFGTHSVFLVSHTKHAQEIWHPHAKFPREFGIHIRNFLETDLESTFKIS